MSAKEKPDKPSQLEMQILGVLWQRGRMTAREVLESLPDGKPRAYTTVLSTMQVMAKKGLIKRDTSGVTHIWWAAAPRRHIVGPMLKDLLRNVFGGRPSAVLQQLLGSGPVSSEEIEAMRQLLDRYDAQQDAPDEGPDGERK